MAQARVADLLRRGLSAARFLLTVCAGHRGTPPEIAGALALTRFDPPVPTKTDPLDGRSFPFPSRGLDAYAKGGHSASASAREAVRDNAASLRSIPPGGWVNSREQTRVISRERQRAGDVLA